MAASMAGLAQWDGGSDVRSNCLVALWSSSVTSWAGIFIFRLLTQILILGIAMP